MDPKILEIVLVQLTFPVFLDFPGGSVGKESVCKVGDLGSTPGLGRSPGEWKSFPFYPLQLGLQRVGHN